MEIYRCLTGLALMQSYLETWHLSRISAIISQWYTYSRRQVWDHLSILSIMSRSSVFLRTDHFLQNLLAPLHTWLSCNIFAHQHATQKSEKKWVFKIALPVDFLLREENQAGKYLLKPNSVCGLIFVKLLECKFCSQRTNFEYLSDADRYCGARPGRFIHTIYQ